MRAAPLLFCLMALAACDSGADPTTPPPPSTPPPTQPQTPPVEGVTRIQLTGIDVYGVRKEFNGDGTSRLIVSDSLSQTFRFGVYALRDTLQVCPPEADVCRLEILGRGERAEVLLSKDITINGITRPAGTDVADHFDFFERDFLLGIFPEPEPLFHVGFDPTRVTIPAGEIDVTVRWVGGSTPFEATRNVTFQQGTSAL